MSSRTVPEVPQSVLGQAEKIKDPEAIVRTFHSYNAMIQRCYYTKGYKYQRYGARGIAVCKAWRNSFTNFLRDMGLRPEGKTLDRIDNDKNYTPTNCQWATSLQQANNRSSNKKITHKGEARTIAQWARVLNVSFALLQSRIDRKWPANLVFEPGLTRRGVEKARRLEENRVRREKFKKELRTCQRCGETFHPKLLKSMYCSRYCGKAAARDAHYYRNKKVINAKRRAARESKDRK